MNSYLRLVFTCMYYCIVLLHAYIRNKLTRYVASNSFDSHLKVYRAYYKKRILLHYNNITLLTKNFKQSIALNQTRFNHSNGHHQW
jgi:hypothetical protein